MVAKQSDTLTRIGKYSLEWHWFVVMSLNYIKFGTTNEASNFELGVNEEHFSIVELKEGSIKID